MAYVLTQDQLRDLRDSFISKWKNYDVLLRNWERRKEYFYRNNQNPIAQFIMPKPLTPEFYPGYNYAVEMMEQIETHSSTDKFPDRLFLSRAPNETDAEYAYRKANYKNTTNPVWVDYIHTVSRANADQNWSFKADPELFDYVNNQVPKYGSTEAFLRNFLPSLKGKDANGIIAIQPYNIPLVRDENGNVVRDVNGMAIVSDEPISPYPVYYSSKNIVGQSDGEWYMVISYERSTVRFGGKDVKMGLTVLIFDSENIYQFSQTGNYNDYEWSDVFVWYPHTLGYVPCQKLKGIPALYGDRTIYVSPFSAAANLLDLVTLDESNLFVTKATTVYNYKVAIGTPCTFERNGDKCRDGILFDSTINNGIGGNIECPACHGAGLRPRMSPFGVLLINPGNALNADGDKGLQGDYLKLVGPPIEGPKFLQEQIDKNERRARKILHIPDADSQVVGEEGKTATGSLNKARATYAFIKPISDQTFEVYEFMIKAISDMRFDPPQSFELTWPQSFDIITPSDMLTIIGELSELNLPPSLISAYIEKYVSSLMYTSDDALAVFKLILNEDLILSMTRDDVNLRVTAKMIEPWRDTLHYGGLQIINYLVDQNPNFFEQDYATQRDQFIKQAQEWTKQAGFTPADMAAEELRRTAEFAIQQ